jgi:hypothetical protein
MTAERAGSILYLVPPQQKPATPEQPSLFDAPQPLDQPKPARYEKKTTKEIKKALQDHFGYPFSVKKGSGTASHWVDVRWIDGPKPADVHDFCLQFNDTGRDDHMTDLWCGCQYTTEQREESYDAWMYAARIVCRKYGCEMPEVVKQRNYDDRYDYAAIKGIDPRIEAAGEYFGTLVHREMYQIDFRPEQLQAHALAAMEEEQAEETPDPAPLPDDFDLGLYYRLAKL